MSKHRRTRVATSIWHKKIISNKKRKFTSDTKPGWIINPGTHPSWPYLPPSSWVSEPEQINLRPLDWLSGWFGDSSCHSLYVCVFHNFSDVTSPFHHRFIRLVHNRFCKSGLQLFDVGWFHTRNLCGELALCGLSSRSTLSQQDLASEAMKRKVISIFVKDKMQFWKWITTPNSKYYNTHIVNLTHDTRSHLFSLSQMLALQSRGWGITLDFALGLGLLLKDFPRISEDIKSNVQNQLPQVII